MTWTGGTGAEDPTGGWSQLLRLQSDFAARLSEETMRYLRGLQGALGPAAPGTVVVPHDDTALVATGSPGGDAPLRVEVTNRQRAHAVVTPTLSPLVAASGTTWFPDAEAAPPYLLVAPGESRTAVITVRVPASLTAGDYRGALLLPGAGDGLAVLVRVTAPDREPGGGSDPEPAGGPAPDSSGRPGPDSSGRPGPDSSGRPGPDSSGGPGPEPPNGAAPAADAGADPGPAS